jgi:hypothetical protein
MTQKNICSFSVQLLLKTIFCTDKYLVSYARDTGSNMCRSYRGAPCI